MKSMNVKTRCYANVQRPHYIRAGGFFPSLTNMYTADPTFLLGLVVHLTSKLLQYLLG
jgi:hypothetical protein